MALGQHIVRHAATAGPSTIHTVDESPRTITMCLPLHIRDPGAVFNVGQALDLVNFMRRPWRQKCPSRPA